MTNKDINELAAQIAEAVSVSIRKDLQEIRDEISEVKERLDKIEQRLDNLEKKFEENDEITTSLVRDVYLLKNKAK